MCGMWSIDNVSSLRGHSTPRVRGGRPTAAQHSQVTASHATGGNQVLSSCISPHTLTLPHIPTLTSSHSHTSHTLYSHSHTSHPHTPSPTPHRGEEVKYQVEVREEMAQLETALASTKRDYEMLRIEFEKTVASNEQAAPIAKELQVVKSLVCTSLESDQSD